MSEVSIDARLSKLQSVKWNKGEGIFCYSNGILKLFIEPESAGHIVGEKERKRALLKDLPRHFDVTAEAIVSGGHSYDEAVFKFTD